MADLPASVFVERPTIGRVVTRTRPVRLGDVDARARLRLDAVARYLQDIATDDATDAELDDAFGWVVRRTMIEVRRAAGLDEQLELSTFCAGTGRSWAERRTSIAGARGASIEAVSLWIRVDPATGCLATSSWPPTSAPPPRSSPTNPYLSWAHPWTWPP